MSGKRRTLPFLLVLALAGAACGASSTANTASVTFEDVGNYASALYGDVALVDVTSLEPVSEVVFGGTPHVTYRATVSRVWHGDLETAPSGTIDVFEVLNYDEAILAQAARRSDPVALIVDVNEKGTPQAEATGTHLSMQGAFSIEGTVAGPSIVSFFGPGLGDAWEEIIRSAGPAMLALEEDAPAQRAVAALIHAANDGRATELDTIIEGTPTEPIPSDDPADDLIGGSEAHAPLLVSVLGDGAADAPASIVRATTPSGVSVQGVIGDGNAYASLTVPVMSGESVEIEIFSGEGLLDEFGSDEFEQRTASLRLTHGSRSTDLDEIGATALLIRASWGPTGVLDGRVPDVEEVPLDDALDLLVSIDAQIESGPSDQDVGP